MFYIITITIALPASRDTWKMAFSPVIYTASDFDKNNLSQQFLWSAQLSLHDLSIRSGEGGEKQHNVFNLLL